MPARGSEVDRSDPAERAASRVRDFERRQRWSRVIWALTLFALASLGPLVAAGIAGDPGATVGAVVGAALLTGCGVVVWPWTWSDAERRHHDLAAIWHEARAGADETTPWDRYAAWAREDGERIELLQIRRAGLGESEAAAPSPFSVKVVRRLDAEAIADAAIAMDALRDDVAALEARARQDHADAQAAAARRPYVDALREVDETASAEQRHAEAEMLRELAATEAAERRAQAAAVARALRRP